jgi:hypothetical protein
MDASQARSLTKKAALGDIDSIEYVLKAVELSASLGLQAVSLFIDKAKTASLMAKKAKLLGFNTELEFSDNGESAVLTIDWDDSKQVSDSV